MLLNREIFDIRFFKISKTNKQFNYLASKLEQLEVSKLLLESKKLSIEQEIYDIRRKLDAITIEIMKELE